jgi:hypothetical protein
VIICRVAVVKQEPPVGNTEVEPAEVKHFDKVGGDSIVFIYLFFVDNPECLFGHVA